MAEMRLSEEGLALIRRFEGLRTMLYADAAGLPTIGYGHLVRAAEIDLYANGIDADRALALLRQDVGIAERAVTSFITAPLKQNQCDALISFTFNLGAATLQRSTLRRIVNRGEHDQVPAQFMRYVWTSGHKSAGLLARRKAEAALYRRT